VFGNRTVRHILLSVLIGATIGAGLMWIGISRSDDVGMAYSHEAA